MFMRMPAVRRCRTISTFLLPVAGALMLAFPGTAAGHALTASQPAGSSPVAILPKMPLQENPPDSLYEVAEYNDPRRFPWDYKAFLKRNPQVEKLVWHWGQNLMALRPARVIVHLKSGEKEIYKYTEPSEMARARKKYGRFPWAAPPVARFDILPQMPQRKEKPMKLE